MDTSVKNRIIEYTPFTFYSDNDEWNQNDHALFYLLELLPGWAATKIGSSGGQANWAELGAFGCVKGTHAGYENRSDGFVANVQWFWIDKSLLSRELDNQSYDKVVHEMIMEYDPLVVKSNINSDALAKIYLNDDGEEEQRNLTVDEIKEYLDVLFNKGKTSHKYPPHTLQKEIKAAREAQVRNAQATGDLKTLLVSVDSLVTRFGKDKTNAISILPETELVICLSGYFATWQITSEFDYEVEEVVYTRGKSAEQIALEIIKVRNKGKRVWLMLSTYNDEESSRIGLTSYFKYANIQILIDEVDYQAWKQPELFEEIISNVV